MKRYFFAFLLSIALAPLLSSCTDPATDIKEGETTTADTTQIIAPTTGYPTDTSMPPVVADTTTIRR